MNTDLATQKIDAAIASLTEAKAALAPDPIPAPLPPPALPPNPPIVVGPSTVQLTDADFAKPVVTLKRDTIYVVPVTGINLTTAGTQIVADGTGTLNPIVKPAAGGIDFRTLFAMRDGLVGVTLRDLILDLGDPTGSKQDGVHLRGSAHTLLNLVIKGGGTGVQCNGQQSDKITIDGLIYPGVINGYGVYTQGDTIAWKHSNWTVRGMTFQGSLNAHAFRVNAMYNLLLDNFMFDQRASTQGYPALNIKWGDRVTIQNGTAFGRNQFGPLQAAGDYDFATLTSLIVSNVKMGGTGSNGCITLEAGVVGATFTDIPITSNDAEGIIRCTYKSPRPNVSALFTRLKATTKRTGTMCYGLNPNTKFVDSAINGNPWSGGNI